MFELKQKLAAMEGHSISQMELLADLEHQPALRNKKTFGDSSEKRPTPKAPREEKPAQPGHGPREQPELAHVERVVRTR